MHYFQVKFVLVTFLVCCYLEIASGSCLSYGHSCWGAHGKRSGPLKKQHSGERAGLAERWALVRLNSDAFPSKGTQQNISPDQRNTDVNLGNLGRQSIDIKPFPMNSDEEDNNSLSTSSGGRDDTGSRTDIQLQRGQRQNTKRTYGSNADFEEDSLDDINMAAIAPIDDIPMDNRNSRFFRFLNPNLNKLVS